jgi:DNA/RNA-binding protein KIN17
MSILRSRFPKREVAANIVYTQLIRDKNHVHMNSTRWESVHGFCLYLEKAGKIKLRMSENGPMIKYINKDADLIEEVTKAQNQEKEMDNLLTREKVLKHMTEMAPKDETQSWLDPQRVDGVVIGVQKRIQEKRVDPFFSGASRPGKSEV